MIDVSHDFVGFFGGSVGGDGEVYDHVFAEGNFFTVAVDGGTGGHDEIFDVVEFCLFEDVLGADAVDFLVEEGVFYGGADSGHGG